MLKVLDFILCVIGAILVKHSNFSGPAFGIYEPINLSSVKWGTTISGRIIGLAAVIVGIYAFPKIPYIALLFFFILEILFLVLSDAFSINVDDMVIHWIKTFLKKLR